MSDNKFSDFIFHSWINMNKFSGASRICVLFLNCLWGILKFSFCIVVLPVCGIVLLCAAIFSKKELIPSQPAVTSASSKTTHTIREERSRKSECSQTHTENQNNFCLTTNEHYLVTMKKYLESSGFLYNSENEQKVNERKDGRHFTKEQHINGLVYSLLSNQTVWAHIDPHLQEIDELFFQYNTEKIKSTDYTYFVQGIYNLKCGNVSTQKQMESLSYNIGVLEQIENEYGSIDAFVTSAPAYKIADMLSDSSSKYKLKMVGTALAWEYLRNVGVDGAKPDTHTRRFLGNGRMGTIRREIATPEEVYNQVEKLASETGFTRVAIDNIIWSYCASGYGAICTANPNCSKCVIKEHCNYKFR